MSIVSQVAASMPGALHAVSRVIFPTNPPGRCSGYSCFTEEEGDEGTERLNHLLR